MAVHRLKSGEIKVRRENASTLGPRQPEDTDETFPIGRFAEVPEGLLTGTAD
jgi:hypothetical protein